MLLATSLFVPAPRSDAEWGGVGGFAAADSPPPPNPVTGDTDGDGMPDAWETANLLNPANAADAASDFDRDGLTALQEYGLHLATAGANGKHLGTWSASWLPRPTGFIGTPRVTIVEQAPNGIILAQVSGRLSDATVSTTFPYTWSPASGTWTRVLPPPGINVTSLTSLDVNSSGQVVGYYSSGGTRGFVWTPGSSGGESAVFQLHTASGSLHAVPKRISDSGHVVGNVGSLSSTGFAGTSDGDEITFSGLLSNPVFHDVNDYGEFIGSAYNPLTWGMETFLALPGQPVFSTGVGGAAFEEMAGVWGDLPEIDPGEIVWDEGPSDYSYFREGTAIDTRTGNPVAVHEGYGAAFYWYYDSGYYDTGWYSYPGFSHVFAGVNDWGEFTGHYNASLYRTDFTEYDQTGYSGFSQAGSDNGIYFFEGDYHVSKSRPAIYGVSNDPRVLIGTPYALWSGSLVVPVTSLLPAGYPTSFAYARLADKGRVILQQSTTSQILLLKPNQDSDGDGMPNDWEAFYGLNPADAQDAAADANQNGTSNRAEFAFRANPLAAAGAGAGVQFIDLRPGIDTDGDGMPNTWEWKHGLNHSDASDAGNDVDGDGLTNLKEFLIGTEPKNPDTDGDGVSDGQEIKNGTDPHSASDLDADGMADHWELDFSRRLLAHRDILSASQIAILETGNFDPLSDILDEGVSNLDRYREEAAAPVLPGASQMTFQGKTRSIWVGYISDQPPAYYHPGGDSYIWMTSYVNGTDLGNIISQGGIVASDPQFTFGLLDTNFPWETLTWWQSTTSESVSRGGWPLASSKSSKTEQVDGPGELPEITVNSCSFAYNESRIRLKASEISGSDRTLRFVEVTTSSSLPPDLTFTWLDPHITATKMHTFVIPAGKSRSETIEISTPLQQGFSSMTRLELVDLDFIKPGTESDEQPKEIAEDKEDSEGEVVGVNWDDDDNSEGHGGHGRVSFINDFDDPNGTTGENDLIQVKLHGVFTNEAKVRIKYDNRFLAIWRNSDRTGKIESESSELQVPTDLIVYLEGRMATDAEIPTRIEMHVKMPMATEYIVGDQISVHVATPIITLAGKKDEDKYYRSQNLAEKLHDKSYLGALRRDDRNNTVILKGGDQSGKVLYYSVDMFDIYPMPEPVGSLEDPPIIQSRAPKGDKEMKMALAVDGAHVFYTGHSNYGIGPNFEKNPTSFDDYMNISSRGVACVDYEDLVQNHGDGNVAIRQSDYAGTVSNYTVPATDLSRFTGRYAPGGENVLSGDVFTLQSATPPGHGFHYKTMGTETGVTNYQMLINSSGDLPVLRYGSCFMSSCNSGRHYSESLSKKTLVFTMHSTYSKIGGEDGSMQGDLLTNEKSWLMSHYVTLLVQGRRWTEIVHYLNANQYWKPGDRVLASDEAIEADVNKKNQYYRYRFDSH